MTSGRMPGDGAPAVAFLTWLRVLVQARHDLISHGQLHAQLAGIELELQKRRLLRLMLLALIGWSTLTCTMLGTAALVVGSSWDSPYRLLAMLSMPLIFGGATCAIWRAARSTLRDGAKSFAASLEELAADAALLRNTE